MCGRVALFTPPVRLAKLLDAALAAGVDPDTRPSWNVGPQRRLFAVTESEEGRVLDAYRWGLLPSWAKDPALANRLFNARGETVAEKPSFRGAFAKRPCVIPVDGFYEWDHRPGKNRQPNFFTRVDGTPLLLAGLYEHWRDPHLDDAPLVATCTVITTSPSADMDDIHDRMPVILERDAVATWLNVLEVSADERRALLRPSAPATLRHHGVANAVGSVKNDGPALIEPLEAQSLF
ncbi:MAG: SOS response-associated peptidase [Acidobacteriota bacterium]|nr:SOS response-associated peptidase [Acidobacteriota bacterium]MDE3221885.1 SOS response-associated peptidase [Acidobacteriota bacterium]